MADPLSREVATHAFHADCFHKKITCEICRDAFVSPDVQADHPHLRYTERLDAKDAKTVIQDLIASVDRDYDRLQTMLKEYAKTAHCTAQVGHLLQY
jgi:hypothetical protein